MLNRCYIYILAYFKDVSFFFLFETCFGYVGYIVCSSSIFPFLVLYKKCIFYTKYFEYCIVQNTQSIKQNKYFYTTQLVTLKLIDYILIEQTKYNNITQTSQTGEKLTHSVRGFKRVTLIKIKERKQYIDSDINWKNREQNCIY